jgi:hypothetical protein
MGERKKSRLKIYSLAQPLLHTEWISILGDKFSAALDFEIEFTDDPMSAQVIAWDGVVSPKLRRLLPQLQLLLEGKTLLLMGESRFLYEKSPLVALYPLKNKKIIQLPGWSILPEEILKLLNECYQAADDV